MVHQRLAHVAKGCASKRRPVVELAVQNGSLSSNELHELANCHTGWKPVGVHDHIGAHTIIIERHVLLPNNQPTHTLLPVAAAEFVAQLGNASASHPDLD